MGSHEKNLSIELKWLDSEETILVCLAPSREILCWSFMRIDHMRESTNEQFRTRAFTATDVIDWHLNKTGKFSYLEDWAGFNIEGRDVERFKSLDFSPYSEFELKFIDKVKGKNPDKFVIIGLDVTDTDFDDVLEHELHHCFWYLDSEYYSNARSIIRNNIPTKTLRKIRNGLKSMGYHKELYDNETQAYLSNDTQYIGEHFNFDPFKEIPHAVELLKLNFKNSRERLEIKKSCHLLKKK